jgi:hypothetical protein
MKFTKVSMINSKGEETHTFNQGDDMTVRLYYYAFERIEEPIFGLNIHTIQGVYIYGTNNDNIHYCKMGPVEGAGYVDFKLSKMILHKGKYFLSAMVFDEPDDPYWQNPLDWHNQAYEFIVFSPTEAHGLVAFDGKWNKPRDAEKTGLAGVPAELSLADQWHFHFLDADWYKQEKGKDKIKFSWSKGDCGFLLLQKKNTKILSVTIKAAHPNIKKNPVSVKLLVDGEQQGEYRLENTNWTTIEIGLQKVKDDKIHWIRLLPDRTWNPEEIGQIGDRRKIGIGLKDAKFS